jgi:hypothetical protein
MQANHVGAKVDRQGAVRATNEAPFTGKSSILDIRVPANVEAGTQDPHVRVDGMVSAPCQRGRKTETKITHDFVLANLLSSHTSHSHEVVKLLLENRSRTFCNQQFRLTRYVRLLSYQSLLFMMHDA